MSYFDIFGRGHANDSCHYNKVLEQTMEDLRTSDRLSELPMGTYCSLGEHVYPTSVTEKKINPNTTKKGKLPVAESIWALDHIARVAEQSKAKGYEPMNWVKPETKCYFVGYLVSAALRHVTKFILKEDYNVEKKEDGTEVKTEFDVLHLENAAYNLLMAAHLFRQGRTDLDDRNYPEKS